jgi:peroxiredoxin
MRRVLVAAGLYNLLWGAVAILLPQTSLSLLGFDPPLNYPQLWQCIGMIVGVYGFAYLIAAADPFHQWPIVFVGLLGKIFGPIGFAWNAWKGDLPVSMGWTIIFNDLIWWVPFTLILLHAVRYIQAEGTVHLSEDYDDPTRDLLTNTGRNIWDLSFERRQLVVFLRHSGCTFCREALADLQQQRAEIEATGCGIVIVHLASDEKAGEMFARYALEDVPRISDPQCRLYRQFGLKHGTLAQLLCLKVWLRGAIAALVTGHGFGAVQGNGFQMPGAFLIESGKFISGFEHACPADRMNFVKFVSESASAEELTVAS